MSASVAPLGLALYGHPLDVYFLAPLGDPDHLALGVYALSGFHGAGLAFADAGADFLLRALHPQVFFGAATLASSFATAFVVDRAHGVPHGTVRRLCIASLVIQYGPFWAGSL